MNVEVFVMHGDMFAVWNGFNMTGRTEHDLPRGPIKMARET